VFVSLARGMARGKTAHRRLGLLALGVWLGLFAFNGLAWAQPDADGFPRTVLVDGKPVTIPHKPVRIAALSGDVGDIVLELVDLERIAAVPLHQDNPMMYRNHEKAAKVRGRLPGAADVDPEAVLAFDPDLIVLTLTHGAELDALELLSLSGIPIVSIRSWSDFDGLMQNVLLIGEAVGEEEKAMAVVEKMRARLDAVEERLAGVEKPWALPLSVISPDGTQPWLIGPTSFQYDLLVRAGARYAGERLGVTRSIVASVEQLIQADPEYLLLTDWSGRGLDAYRDFLAHPGMQAVTAVEKGNVLILPYRELWHTLDAIEGLEKVAAWLHPDRFDETEGSP